MYVASNLNCYLSYPLNLIYEREASLFCSSSCSLAKLYTFIFFSLLNLSNIDEIEGEVTSNLSEDRSSTVILKKSAIILIYSSCEILT